MFRYMNTLLSFTSASSRRICVVVAASALFLTACGGASSSSPPPIVTETETASPAAPSSSDSAEQPNPTTAETTQDKPQDSSTPDSPVADIPPLGNPTMGQKQQDPNSEFTMSISGIRVAEHESFTRVVIDIVDGAGPGWWIDWTTDPIQQASGLPVDVAGDSFLNVNIDGIGYPGQAPHDTIPSGPYPGAGIVQGINLTSIFEARAQILIGVEGEPRDYSVSLLQEPTRVVIDIVD